MKQLAPILFAVGATTAFVRAATFITEWVYVPYIYTIEAGFMALTQINTPLWARSRAFRRLHTQQVFGALALMLAGAFIFITHSNEQIIYFTITAILELYTAFRVPQEEEKGLSK